MYVLTDPWDGILPLYDCANHQSFPLNFALNPTQRNFQDFVDHLQVNTVLEIIFSYEFESDNEEGGFIIWILIYSDCHYSQYRISNSRNANLSSAITSSTVTPNHGPLLPKKRWCGVNQYCSTICIDDKFDVPYYCNTCKNRKFSNYSWERCPFSFE